jgi:hypothetical protein
VGVDYDHAYYEDYGQHGFEPKPPSDPNGYDKFDKTRRQLNNGHVADEHSTAVLYDKYRREQTHIRHPHRQDLALLRSNSLELARRIAKVAKTPGEGGWHPYDRRWRFNQFIARWKGELVVK